MELVRLVDVQLDHTYGKREEEERREEGHIRAMLERLEDELIGSESGSHPSDDQPPNGAQQQLEGKFLLQLDVAQTLDSMLHCVERWGSGIGFKRGDGVTGCRKSFPHDLRMAKFKNNE